MKIEEMTTIGLDNVSQAAGEKIVQVLGELYSESRKRIQLGDKRTASLLIYDDCYLVSSWFDGRERNVVLKGTPTIVHEKLLEG